MARKICQSCSMPLRKDEIKGTNADGSLSEDYCMHCYHKGEFTWPEATAEEMQIYCTGLLMRRHWPGFMAKMATHGIPKLNRWQKV